MVRIKELRTIHGITQDSLGQMIGVQKAAISKYERGTVAIPQKHMVALCDIFGVTSDALLGREELYQVSDKQEFGLENNEVSGTNTKFIPLLGRVHAGEPMFAVENIEDYIPHNESEVKNGDYFYMEVVGDCMIGDFIPEGAHILVEHTNSVRSGQIAVVRVDDEVVLRRIKFMNDCIVLIPSNTKYEPMIVMDGDVEVVGRVAEVRFKI